MRKIECSKCDRINDRLPQRYCKKCHAAAQVKDRKRIRDELLRLRKLEEQVKRAKIR